MHGRTFKVVNTPTTITVWDYSVLHGRATTMIGKDGGCGIVKLPSGAEHLVRYQEMALGDNSK